MSPALSPLLLSLLFSLSPVESIVNGQISAPDRWPFMVALFNIFFEEIPGEQSLYRKGHTFQCGAVVYDELHILTAAHCAFGRYEPLLEVLVGQVNITVPLKTHLFQVEEIIIHEEYINDSHQDNDIAILRLSRPIHLGSPPFNGTSPYPHVEAVEIATTKNILHHSACVVLGWGANEKGEMSTDLREAIVHLEWCSPECVDGHGKIRAGDVSNGVDVCFGDSGGPMICPLVGAPQHYRLVGLTSQGGRNVDRCHEGIVLAHGVYTYLSHYVDWIRWHVEESRKKKK